MSAELLHHQDDGTENEYWWIQDGPGNQGVIDTFANRGEAIQAFVVYRRRKRAKQWIAEHDTGCARTIQEKAKYLVGRLTANEAPAPEVWWEVLKISRGL